MTHCVITLTCEFNYTEPPLKETLLLKPRGDSSLSESRVEMLARLKTDEKEPSFYLIVYLFVFISAGSKV